MEHRVTSTNVCLNFFECYWLPSFPQSPGRLKRQVSCYMPTIAKRRLMQVTEQLGSASGCPIRFFGCCDRPSNGDWLQSCASQKKYDTPALGVRLCHSTVWNMGELTLEINLYELTAPFECCILEMERMESWENSLRFWNRKCSKWVKNCLVVKFVTS
jgi:hypothetical protein